MYEPSDARSSGRLLAVALFLATLFAYSGVWDNEFVTYDDGNYVTNNERVLAGLSLDGVRWALTSTEYCNWHPLTWMSHMLDVSLFGVESAAGHHASAVLLHALSALILFAALRSMTSSVTCSALVAALFALHPLRVESVAWVSERKDVLSGLMWMVCLWLHARWVKAPRASTRALLHVAYALGLMAKPMLVTLPFVLLLLDHWPLARRAGIARLVREKTGLFALSVVACALTFFAQKEGGCTGFIEGGLAVGPRVENALVSTLQYGFKTLWPADLAFFYPHPAVVDPESSRTSLAFGAGVVLLLVSALALRLRRSAPAVLVGWLWFLGTLVPVLGLVQVGGQALADRYVYLPLVGLQISAVWGCARLAELRPGLRRPLGALALVACAALGARTGRQVEVWRDSHTLFEHALAVTEGNYVALINLGRIESEEGRAAGAEGRMAEARELIERSCERFAEAARLAPGFYGARLNHGWALNVLGRFDEALGELEIAVELRPWSADSRLKLALCLINLGDGERAGRELDEVRRLEPEHDELGRALELLQELRERSP